VSFAAAQIIRSGSKTDHVSALQVISVGFSVCSVVLLLQPTSAVSFKSCERDTAELGFTLVVTVTDTGGLDHLDVGSPIIHVVFYFGFVSTEGVAVRYSTVLPPGRSASSIVTPGLFRTVRVATVIVVF